MAKFCKNPLTVAHTKRPASTPPPPWEVVSFQLWSAINSIKRYARCFLKYFYGNGQSALYLLIATYRSPHCKEKQSLLRKTLKQFVCVIVSSAEKFSSCARYWGNVVAMENSVFFIHAYHAQYLQMRLNCQLCLGEWSKNATCAVHLYEFKIAGGWVNRNNDSTNGNWGVN